MQTKISDPVHVKLVEKVVETFNYICIKVIGLRKN